MTAAELRIAINPDELGQDPVAGMNLANELGVGWLEIRTAFGANALLLDDEAIMRVAALARERELRVAALASPLFKWCDVGSRVGGVDRFGFPTHVSRSDRLSFINRALRVAELLDTRLVRIFSNLRTEESSGERFENDALLEVALAKARAIGISLLLENEPVCTVATHSAVRAVLDRHSTAGLGLWLDLGNLHEVGDATPQSVAHLAQHTYYVHIKDFRSEGGLKRFCVAGQGEVDYGELLPCVSAHAPTSVFFGVETHVRHDPAGAIRGSVAYLRTRLTGTR